MKESKRESFIVIGIMLIIASVIIYFTKGEAYIQFTWGRVVSAKYILHLIWFLLTSLLGIGIVFLGLEKDK